MKNKILNLTINDSIYSKKYENQIKINSKNIEIVNFFGSKLKNKYFNKINMILKLKKTIKDFDLVHINFLTPSYFLYNCFFKHTKLIVTFWGSDLYRYPNSSKKIKFLQKKIINNADIITVVNKKMIPVFHETFGFENKPIYETRFGLPIDFDQIDKINKNEINDFKKKYHIPDKYYIITLGYSSDPRKNHEYMIDEIIKLSKKRSNIFIFIPLTYGNEKHKEKIKKLCDNTFKKYDINYKVLEDYMTNEEIAKLRKANDIMINIQDTDAMSASMQESLYAGNIVINGSWLPYSELLEDGAYYETIDKLKKGTLSEKIQYIINNFDELKEKSKINKKIIHERSSWENNIKSWIEVYNKLLEE
ncbi:glycosyltransferase involved in cell wall biosynthesis [Oceanotoga teriensis]|uniref:Glycosyltransferase involved in cell wall biosynthesis n=1 Tax=Oceanotoga teriensis TaxID=515440 RepID=A0AA45C588_9BACT|nr:glycosyltransferase [Oceanotoga teriensis]PWJ88098.1 glycosyltransferase involved in cell wall biosynthesis [Oceanotoga teriensis]